MKKQKNIYLNFLEKEGFLQVKLSSTNYVLVRIVNNRVAESSSNEIIKVVREHLENIKESDVYEAFARGSVSFTGKSKLNLLKSIEMVDDLDGKDNSHFFFKNHLMFCLYLLVQTTHDYTPVQQIELTVKSRELTHLAGFFRLLMKWIFQSLCVETI